VQAIAVALPMSSNPFWVSVRRGVEKAAQELNNQGRYQILIRETVDLDPLGQVEILNNFLERGDVVALLVGPASDNTIVPAVSKYASRGIPVVVIDTPLDSKALGSGSVGMSAFIGSDNKQGGVLAGQSMLAALEGKPPSVLLLKGKDEHQSAIDRSVGFNEAVANKGIEVTTVEGEWSRLKAQELTYAQYSKKRFGGVFAHNDDMAMGAIQALRLLEISEDEWPVVIGFDATSEGLSAIERGEMYASVKQDPITLGYEGLRSAFRILSRDGAVESTRLLKPSLVPPQRVSK
jgi:ABC-type sugar transport system substrate-binding protein